MPLPFIFAAATTVTTPQIDANFAALGALTAIASTVTGTNALTFSPLPNTPTISAYANYQPFSGIAAATNTGAATARVGGLAALNIYKDASGGPALLTGNEIVAGNLITLVYDTALNAGAGGFHLQTGPANGAGIFLPLTGGTLSGNLKVPTLTIASGPSITRILSTTASLTWSVVAAGGSQDQTVTLSGASIGDVISLGMPSVVTAGIIFDGRVSATGVVAVRATNGTSATVTPAAGTYRVALEGFT